MDCSKRESSLLSKMQKKDLITSNQNDNKNT